jgi:hypothetical protein
MEGAVMASDAWTVLWIEYTSGEPRGELRHDVVRDRASLEAKIIAVGPGCLVVPGEPLTFYVDTSPRITFGEPAAKKTRKQRSDAGRPRKAKPEPEAKP